MKLDRMLVRIGRIVAARLVHLGLMAGIDRAAGVKRGPDDAGQDGAKPTPEQRAQTRAQQRQAKQTAKKAKRAARLIRRIGRF